MKRKKLFKYLIIIFIALLLFAIIGKRMGIVGQQERKKVSVDKVERRDIIETVTASGKIQPVTEVKITSDVSGEVIELYVQEGDEVKKGDLLAKINPDIYLSTLDRMKATLNSQKANLANMKARLAQVQAQFVNAELSYKRNKQLWDQQAISDAEYDAAKSQYEVAKAEVEAARQSVAGAEYSVESAAAALKEAQENLSKTTVYAPVDGTVSKLLVEKGERVVGTSQFQGTEMMTIADLSQMEVVVSVNENDIIRLELGDTSIIEVDAYLEKEFKGIVTHIANSANTTGLSADQVTNFDVKIRILPQSYQELMDAGKNLNAPFRPGMSATVDIQTEFEYNVLSVPIQAVTTRMDTLKNTNNNDLDHSSNGNQPDSENDNNNDGRKEIVFVFLNDHVEMHEVETGIQDNTYIEIKSGVEEGMEVVTAPYRAVSKQLKNNDQVEKVEKSKLFSD